MFSKRAYHCPCLMAIIDEMEILMINDLNGILIFLREIEKSKVFSKVFCVKLINQTDLMILCENHLNVLIYTSSKNRCSADKGGVLIDKMNKRYCKGCVRNCCSKMTEFFVYKIFNF